MITLEDYYMGRDKEYPPTDSARINATKTVEKANALLDRFGQRRSVRSGYRPESINAATPGAAPHSKHITCEAIDLSDLDRALTTWCLSNLSVLEKLGLYMEAPECTPSWLHVQIVAPRSLKRIFLA
jgi:hypothetical protein